MAVVSGSTFYHPFRVSTAPSLSEWCPLVLLRCVLLWQLCCVCLLVVLSHVLVRFVVFSATCLCFLLVFSSSLLRGKVFLLDMTHTVDAGPLVRLFTARSTSCSPDSLRSSFIVSVFIIFFAVSSSTRLALIFHFIYHCYYGCCTWT